MKKANLQKGFTLIEMIVSLGIFAVVAVIAIGALLKISDANRKAIILKTSINNLNFALEAMSREMRFGSNFECASGPSSLNNNQNTNCPQNNSWVIAFDSSEEGNGSGGTVCRLRYAYWLKTTANQPSVLKKAQEEICGATLIRSESAYYDIVSSELRITDSKVTIDTTDQPKVRFWIKGESGKKAKDVTSFSLQTTMSQRTPL